MKNCRFSQKRTHFLLPLLAILCTITLHPKKSFGLVSDNGLSIQSDTIISFVPADTLHITVNCGTIDSSQIFIHNNGEDILEITPNYNIDGPKILALTTYADFGDEYPNTLMAINSYFSDYELFQSNAYNALDLATDLEEIDILLVPEQEGDGNNFFSNLAPTFTDFVYNGGQLLICGNSNLGNIGFFNDAEYQYSNSNMASNINPSHPIMADVPAVFPISNGTFFYDWSEDPAIETYVTFPAGSNGQVVVSKSYGDGQVFYVGYDFDTVDSNNSRIIGNCMEHLVENLEPDWFESVSLDSTITILPGDSGAINVNVDATELFAGDYFSTINYLSNLPDSDTIDYVIHLEVLGEPLLGIEQDSISFESILAGSSTTDSVIIYNQGCEDLTFSATWSESVFGITPDSFSIPPFSQDTLIVEFSPNNSGDFNDVISIETNAEDTLIVVNGSALPAPDIVVNPTNISLEATACQDSILISFDIFNEGEGILEYNLKQVAEHTELNEVKSILDENFEAITDLIPNIHSFVGGENGYSIYDGGGDMYDNGNYLNTNFENAIPYTESEIINNNSFGDNSAYFTSKHPGLFVLAANIDDVSSFSVSGNLGADGTGERNGLTLEYSAQDGSEYKGFVTRVFNNFSPTVNHLIITEANSNVNHSFLESTFSEDHQVYGLNDNERIYYLLFSTESNEYISNSSMEEIFEEFAQLLSFPVFSSGQNSGVVDPGNSTSLELYLNISGYEAGIQQIPLLINSNDPDTPVDTLWVDVEIPGDACSGFTFETVTNCNGTVIFSDDSYNDPTSWSWSFGDGASSTQQSPTHEYDQMGVYDVSLEVCNAEGCNTSSQLVTIEDVTGPALPNCWPTVEEGQSDYHITGVDFHTLNHTSSGSPTGFEDFTCLTTVEIEEGNTYELSVDLTSNESFDVNAWIDFNNDGNFSDQEHILSAMNEFGTATELIEIPFNAVTEEVLRMRVLADTYSNQPCGSLTNGEAEDYAIFIIPNTSPPVTNFSWDDANSCDGLIQFTDNTENGPTSWEWDFGDGESSTTQNPIHDYGNGGTYVVQLTTTNEFGSNTYQSIVEVPYQGIESINLLSSAVIDEPIFFEVQSQGVESWNWNFGDGNTAETTTPNASHTYSSVGTYQIAVSTEENVCFTSASIIINVVPTDIEEHSGQFSVNIYPIPSNGLLNVEYPNQINLKEIRIFDSVGKEMSFDTEASESGYLTLKLSQRTSGLYIIQLTTSHGNVIRKRLILNQ
ncbi:PKD domain-containing protein [Halocola ammonii]